VCGDSRHQTRGRGGRLTFPSVSHTCTGGTFDYFHAPVFHTRIFHRATGALTIEYHHTQLRARKGNCGQNLTTEILDFENFEFRKFSDFLKLAPARLWGIAGMAGCAETCSKSSGCAPCSTRMSALWRHQRYGRTGLFGGARVAARRV